MSECCKQINRKHDYRTHNAGSCWGNLGELSSVNRLSGEDLRGLREDKMKSIRSLAKFLREGAA